MSGHSKWSTIKRQKGVADAKRGQAFAKAAAAITIAARESGESPETNFKLRLAVESAKRINMPKENIQRAIDKGVGKGGNQVAIEEAVYEGFGPAGVSIIVEALTDNKLRTAQEVRSTFEKGGGSLGGLGSVSYLFTPTGEIDVEKVTNADELLLAAADAGADDVEVEEPVAAIYCRPGDLEKVKKGLEDAGFAVSGSELSMKPKDLVKVEDSEKAEKVLSLVNKLDQLQDVQKVYSNYDISDEILQKETT